MRGVNFILINNKNISPHFVSETTTPSQFPHCMETCSHQMNQSQWNKFNVYLKIFFNDLLVNSLKKKTLPFNEGITPHPPSFYGEEN